MIRLFQTLCKSTLEHLSDEAVFQASSNGFSHYSERCPDCGAVGKLTTHGYYSRFLVSHDGKQGKESIIMPLRFECTSCGVSHALLPGNLLPYSPYSLRFKLTVLIAYFERKMPVAAICAHFGIAISTLYSWKQRLLEHKGLLLGALISRETPALDFLRDLFASVRLWDQLEGFFSHFGFSFLQNRPGEPATKSNPP